MLSNNFESEDPKESYVQNAKRLNEIIDILVSTSWDGSDLALLKERKFRLLKKFNYSTNELVSLPSATLPQKVRLDELDSYEALVRDAGIYLFSSFC